MQNYSLSVGSRWDLRSFPTQTILDCNSKASPRCCVSSVESEAIFLCLPSSVGNHSRTFPSPSCWDIELIKLIKSFVPMSWWVGPCGESQLWEGICCWALHSRGVDTGMSWCFSFSSSSSGISKMSGKQIQQELGALTTWKSIFLNIYDTFFQMG